MARLNEPPAPTESIESIKRRFIRQNREFARVNSNQSVKIRALETEVTELINDNRQLREQILSLHNELSRQHGSPNVFEKVSTIQSQLQSRLQDLQELVGGLGDVSKASCRRRTTLNTSALLNIDRRSKIAAMEPEGLLSPIAEGKYYPRRTIEPDEVMIPTFETSAEESPNVGPPPTTLFDSELIARASRVLEEDDLPGLSSINLEPRRRRRSSVTKAVDLDVMNAGIESSGGPNLGQPMRIGAKRKLDWTHGYENDKDSLDSKSRDDQKSLSDTGNTDAVSYDRRKASPTRRALAPKSVNNDPIVSPRKAALGAKRKDTLSSVPLAKTKSDRPRNRTSTSDRVSIELQGDRSLIEARQTLPTVEIKLEPKTPSASEFLSPQATKPNESISKGRPTPPPTDLIRIRDGATTTTDTSSVAGRARRNRASVSYAEPSLVSKMRRPGKEMVDAVSGSHSRSESIEPPFIYRDPDVRDDQVAGEPWQAKRTTAPGSAGLSRPSTALRESAQAAGGASRVSNLDFKKQIPGDGMAAALDALSLDDSSPEHQDPIDRGSCAVRLSRRQTISESSLDAKARQSSREAKTGLREDKGSRVAPLTSSMDPGTRRDNAATRRRSMML